MIAAKNAAGIEVMELALIELRTLWLLRKIYIHERK